MHKGYTVTALIHNNSPYHERIKTLGVNLIQFRPCGFHDVFTAWKIRTWLKSARPSVIVAHNGRAIALLSWAAYGLGIPVYGVCHSYKTKYVHGATVLIMLTEAMRKHFINEGFSMKKIFVIPNLVHLAPTPPRLLRNPPVIGAIGRLVTEKGFYDLLQALHVLKQSGMVFEACIAGDGPQRLMLESISQDLRVRFVGWLHNKVDFYRSLDILCVPSHYESFGIVIIEALAHGVVVVATDTDGALSIITHEVNGLLVPRGNVPALAEALSRVLLEPSLAIRLSQNGSKHVQKYSFESIVTLWDIVLSSALQRTSEVLS